MCCRKDQCLGGVKNTLQNFGKKRAKKCGGWMKKRGKGGDGKSVQRKSTSRVVKKEDCREKRGRSRVLGRGGPESSWGVWLREGVKFEEGITWTGAGR